MVLGGTRKLEMRSIRRGSQAVWARNALTTLAVSDCESTLVKP